MKLFFFFFCLLFANYSYCQNSNKQKSTTTPKNILASTQNDTIKVDILNKLFEQIIIKDPIKALKYSDKAYKIAVKSKYTKGQAYALFNSGTAFYFLDSYEKAFKLLNKSEQVFEMINDTLGLGLVYNAYGEIYTLQGKYSNAIKSLFRSLKYFVKVQDNNRIAKANNNIGIIYKNLEEYDDAIKYFLISLEKSSNISKGDASLNLGTCYIATHNYSEALKYANRAFYYGKQNNDKYVLSNAMDNLGLIEFHYKNYGKAIDLFTQSIQIKEELKDMQGIAFSNNHLGKVFFEQNKLEQAIFCFEKSKEIALKIGVKKELANAYYGLSMAYSKKNEFSKTFTNLEIAFESLKNFNEINKEILNEETSKKLAQKQAELLEEKKNNEIFILKKDNEIESSKRKITLAIVVGLLAIMMLVAFLIYYRYKLKTRANFQLKEQNLIILQQNEEITTQRDEIELKNEVLNEHNEEIRTHRDLVTKQKDHIEGIFKELKSSINYAQRIQTSVLPNKKLLEEFFSDLFILFKPKDVVSGDFYWFAKIENQIVLAVADCTGHGVPGALMSMLGMSLLNEIVVKENNTQTNIILDLLRTGIIKALGQTGQAGEQHDGMDISLLSINTETLQMHWSGAHNPCLIISNGELVELKGNRMPVSFSEKMGEFTLHEIQLKKNDIIYLTTDGYHDQFGGPNDRKFMLKRFKELLLSISDRPMVEQIDLLVYKFEEWKNNHEVAYVQFDDVTVLGLKL